MNKRGSPFDKFKDLECKFLWSSIIWDRLCTKFLTKTLNTKHTLVSTYTSNINSVLDKNAYEHRLIGKIPNFSIHNITPTILGE